MNLPGLAFFKEMVYDLLLVQGVWFNIASLRWNLQIEGSIYVKVNVNSRKMALLSCAFLAQNDLSVKYTFINSQVWMYIYM